MKSPAGPYVPGLSKTGIIKTERVTHPESITTSVRGRSKSNKKSGRDTRRASNKSKVSAKSRKTSVRSKKSRKASEKSVKKSEKRSSVSTNRKKMSEKIGENSQRRGTDRSLKDSRTKSDVGSGHVFGESPEDQDIHD